MTKMTILMALIISVTTSVYASGAKKAEPEYR